MRFTKRKPGRVDLTLHVGSGKTGTSSLQFFCRDNRAALAEHGLLFPKSPGKARHSDVSLYMQTDEGLLKRVGWARRADQDPGRFRAAFEENLQTEIREHGLPRLLLSDEALFSQRPDAIERLKAFTDRIARSVRVVVYLRRQDELLISRYQQIVKEGELRRLSRFAELKPPSRSHLQRLENWSAAMRPDRLVVRPFETVAFKNGSLYDDFFDAAGFADVPLGALSTPVRRNDSLDADSVEFLRLFNIYRVEHEGATPRVINNVRYLARLAARAQGPVLSLSEEALDAYMEQWAADNAEIARRYLGAEDGVLFHAPRKAANTVTEQRLDPALVAEFVELLELPDSIIAPLTEIAEREAAAAV